MDSEEVAVEVVDIVVAEVGTEEVMTEGDEVEAVMAEDVIDPIEEIVLTRLMTCTV